MTYALIVSNALAVLALVVAYLSFQRATRTERMLNQLFSGQEYSKDDLVNFLRKNLKEMKSYKQYVETLDSKIRELQRHEKNKLYKVGLERFNPFKDTGGDQSFVLTVMDDNNIGVMITAIHSREGTRMYAKTIDQNTKTKQLSEEERLSYARAVKSSVHKV